MKRVISYLLGNGAAQAPGTWGSGFAVGTLFGMLLMMFVLTEMGVTCR